MITFNKTCAQGDVYFRRIEKSIPSNAVKQEPEGNELIVTHSETGHHHVMVLDREDEKVQTEEPAVEMFNDKDNPLLSWLKVNRPTTLEHKRSFDTHTAIMFKPGVYEVRREREFTPEGWRRVQD